MPELQTARRRPRCPGLFSVRVQRRPLTAAISAYGRNNADAFELPTRYPLKRSRKMSREPKKLDELFYDTLKDVYFAEKKILTALPKMKKAAQNGDLKAAFEKHRGETEGQVERLEQVFAIIEKKPQGKTCDAIMGLVKEGEEVIQEYKGSPALDAGLLAVAQSVEHYEISRYGTLKAWAAELGHEDAVTLLDETLEEEKNTDAALTELAESVINQGAEAKAA
jgi:ferritin-like metal-binding protein YciE